MRSFRRSDLSRALDQHRAIQGTLLRSTIHMVSARDYWLFLAGVRASRQQWFLRITRKEHGEVDMERAAAVIRRELAAGPRRMTQLRKAQILPEPYRPLVFDVKTPHSTPTFLVDGQVAGSWRYQSGTVSVRPFESLPSRVRADVDQEARRLADFLR